MQLPSNIEDLFTQTFNGFRSVKVRTATEAVAVENALNRQSKSYQTKITRSKKHGREFVVLLLEKLTRTGCTQDCNQGRACTCAGVPNVA
jgi:hypothetical protein